ncbi:MAG: YajQ family cyclic di-GMP-binding protein [Myxococcota bacterium]|nr:YajQ family cyclic di-GMP-binding protein [Myxococcota bacterium]
MPSFDVVSKLDHHEVDNAVDQAKREIATRFDFKDTGTEIEKNADGISIKSSSEGRVEGAYKVLEDKMIKRKVSLKALDPQKAQQSGMTWRQLVKLKEGVETEHAKQIVKTIKESKVKVQAAIQGDLVRVTGKKRDELQEVIALLRGQDFPLPLQFINFRE